MRILQLLLATVLATVVPAAPKPHTTVELVLSVEAARPGDTVLAGIRLRSEPRWHTYWKNGGESGAPTEIKWQLPAGLTAGEIQWPTPERYVAEGLTTYVYHGETLLLVPLKVAADAKPGALELKAKVEWLECEELCIPGDGEIAGTLQIGSEPKPSTHAATLEAARKKLPQTGVLKPTAEWTGPSASPRSLALRWPDAARAAEAEFFPEAGDGFEILPAIEALPDGRGLALKVSSSANTWPKQLRGVVVFKVDGQRQAHEVATEIAGAGTTQSAPRTRGAAAPDDVRAAEAVAATTAPVFPPLGVLLLQLLAALGGGVILNLMPCVLPILSLKVLSLVRQSGQAASVARRHSLLYTLGVLVSFWIVAGLVLGGQLATWGAQFQDARFIVVITVLLVLVALNLFGVFELLLPGRAAGAAANLASREGDSGAFFNGVLAVVLGASCVAPLMAAAIGWAVSQPPVVVVMVFTALGLGLALPYLLVTFFPPLRAMLPKPGAWMEKFKMAMGFPMLATAAWTFSLSVDHYGGEGVLWLGLSLVLLALAVWIYGEFVQRGSRRTGLATVIALLCAGLGYGFALEHKLDWRHPNYDQLGNTAPANTADGIQWQPWSTEAVAAARAEGRPVFVDFTAKWCLTCKANLASSIEIASVRAKLKEINAVALLGDFTLKDPKIAEELKRFERAGVPLVLVYPRNATAPPEILPSLLTPGIVLDALERAAK